jgi:hypothetical protein
VIIGVRHKRALPSNSDEKIGQLLDAKADEALRAIGAKNYGAPYRARGNPIIEVGVGVYGKGKALAKIKA